ncbi:centromere protein N-like [Acanthaster planci]|uniref:Centromere protein N-like n=1 Tax=Acanthaster planci TaxID=133434 RepID=A0A8B7ZQ62_ACAPL|nr:centromere protein N-like [Acanthaster planci]
MINANIEFSLRKVLGRFRRDEFVRNLKDWSFISSDSLREVETVVAQSKSSRKALVERVVQLTKVKKLTTHAVAQLDLIYQQNHPNNKKWSVFQLSKQQEYREKHVVTSPDAFQEQLGKQLSFYFKNDLCLRTKGDAWWVRLGIQEGSQSQRLSPSNVVYMVHHPHSQYIILSSIRVSHKDFVMQALLNSLHCSEIREIQLTGRDLDSLASLALHSNSQGWFSQFRLGQVDHNPLSKAPSRKRKASTDVSDSDIVFENQADKEQREQQILHAFGSNEQPKLQKIEYRLETRFRGSEFAPAMALRKEPFHCKVKFEGSSVLEGIKELGKVGLTSLPLPHHLGNVHSLAKNHFVLADKKRVRPEQK